MFYCIRLKRKKKGNLWRQLAYLSAVAEKGARYLVLLIRYVVFPWPMDWM